MEECLLFNHLESLKDDYEKYVLSMDNTDFSNNGINIIEFLKNEVI